MFGLPPIDHSAVPRESLTEARAQSIMQQHKECPVTVCRVKSQAKRLLIESGKLVPAFGGCIAPTIRSSRLP